MKIVFFIALLLISSVSSAKLRGGNTSKTNNNSDQERRRGLGIFGNDVRPTLSCKQSCGLGLSESNSLFKVRSNCDCLGYYEGNYNLETIDGVSVAANNVTVTLELTPTSSSGMTYFYDVGVKVHEGYVIPPETESIPQAMEIHTNGNAFGEDHDATISGTDQVDDHVTQIMLQMLHVVSAVQLTSDGIALMSPTGGVMMCIKVE